MRASFLKVNLLKWVCVCVFFQHQSEFLITVKIICRILLQLTGVAETAGWKFWWKHRFGNENSLPMFELNGEGPPTTCQDTLVSIPTNLNALPEFWTILRQRLRRAF